MNPYAKLGFKAAVAVALSLGALACGDDDSGDPQPDSGVSLDGGFEASTPPPPPADAAVDASTPITGIDSGVQAPAASIYAYLIHFVNADGNLDFYVSVTRSADFNSIDLSKARQVAPYSGMMVVDGFLFIGESNGPFIYKYKVEDDLSLTEVAKINFGSYPLKEGETLNFYSADFLSSTLAFQRIGLDGVQRVQWNPSAATITGLVTETQIPEISAESAAVAAGNRTEMNFWKGTPARAFGTISPVPPDYPGLPTSYIATYDKTTGAEKLLHRIDDCPGLAQSTEDEQGNQYFSPTYPDLVKALYNQGPAGCVVKLKADGTLDAAFPKTDLTKYLNGNFGINLRYVKNNKATAHVLHKERIPARFNLGGSVIDPELESVVWDDASVWELAVIDLATGTSKEFTGFMPEDDVGKYGRHVTIDGKTFFVAHRPKGDAYYELDVENAKATFVTALPGEIWSAFPVR